MSSVFLKLNKNIQNFLAKKNISLPTEPQTIAIPPILAGKNILLIAPTGHGKTESALLPIFHNFLKIKENNFELKGISILYITPLRALNRDMLKRTFEWGKKLGIKIAVRHGDTSQSERVRQSKNPPDMLITTPETLQILFTGKRLRKHLESIRFVIVDEIHELAGDERGAQLSVGLERLNELNKLGNFQRVGLSATVGSPEEVSKFLGGYKDNKFRDVTILDVDITKHIEIAVEIPEIKKTDYSYSNKLSIEPISFASLRRCKELIDSNKSCLVFINTRDGAEILSSRFHQWVKDFAVDVHHGSLSKNSRIEAEDNFKAGHLKSLICTSSLELGIDVGLTDFVIQYNSPREVKRIVQRVGRSGHSIGKTSKGLIIATSPEDLVESTVIAKRALNGKIEKLNIRQNPLSVLSNQIISMALEYGKISTDEIYKIVTRAYPFYKLKKELFLKVLDQLKNQRSLWLEDNFVIKKLSSRHYFLENISMIPDEKTFLAVDISSRKKIGKLDESFVLNYGFEGAKFILRGRPWVVVKTEDDKLLISDSKEIGNAPSWTGEDIPIPFEVAKEVGTLRKNRLFKGYPWDEKSYSKFIIYLESQKKQGFIIPDDKTITIDVSEKTVVINACFGTKVNETMARIISAMLVQQLGESIGINSDAYRITLELPARIHPEKIKNLFLQIKPESLFYLLDRILKNSTYVRWELVNVARKFGAIKKDFDYRNVSAKKLFTLFENTLIFDEAVDKIIWEKMDIENTKEVLSEIQNGKIKIHIQGLSPISLAGIDTIKGLMAPQRADRSILMALKKRLEESDISLVCMNCNKTWDSVVSRTDEKVKCANCGAIKIAVIRRYYKDLARVLKKKDRTKEEDKEIKRLHKNAGLVLNYGKPAIFALVGRGIGPDTAARILSRYSVSDLYKSEEIQIKFLKDILKAELTYARTRGFWDS